MTDTRAEAIAWRRAQDALQCDEVRPWAHGSVLLTPTVSDFWDANGLRVEDEHVSAETMLAAVDAQFPFAEHRKVDVEDTATGAAARPFFAARGWLNERHAVMRRVGPAPPVTHDVAEVPLAATRALRAEWNADLEPDTTFPERQDRVLARRGARAFMVAELGFAILCSRPAPGAGAAGAVSRARAAEQAVEIDGLYVTQAARGQGIGASLIGAALQGARTAWIVADDEGRARALYDRLGFETVWQPYCFVKTP